PRPLRGDPRRGEQIREHHAQIGPGVAQEPTDFVTERWSLVNNGTQIRVRVLELLGYGDQSVGERPQLVVVLTLCLQHRTRLVQQLLRLRTVFQSRRTERVGRVQ